MSIPKLLHYGAFAGHKLSALNLECLKSWHEVTNDYELRFWSDADLPDNRFVKEALATQPVNVHSYMRFWVLEQHGGVFLDNDVEVFKPFDLSPAMFLGFQRSDSEDDCIGDAVLGSVPHHPLLKKILTRLNKAEGDTWPVWCSCTLLTQELRKMGMHGLNVAQRVGDIVVHNKDDFYPWGFDAPKDPDRITKKTIAAHYCEGSWRK